MVIATYTVEKDYTDPKYIQYHSRLLDFYLGSAMHKKIGVLDIETTGLSPQNSHFILGGLLIYQEEGVTLRQYFAESLEEERQTLLAYLRDIQQLDILITYNGKHFDLKFLQGRMRALSLWEDFIFPFNLDLYLLINGHSSLRKLLPNLKQKTVENFMGLWADRADEISGAESVELYKRFLYTKDPEIRRLIMLHNSDDVLQLSQLLPVTEKSDIHKAFFSLGFPVEDLHVSKIAFHSGNLQICGRQRNPLTYAAYQLDDCSCSLDFDRYSEEFSMELPIIKRSGLMIADTRVFDADFSALQKYDTYDSGFLVLKQGDTVHYRETNHFVKLITERVREVLPI